MFPLTAQRRRIVCRLLFLTLAVAPTLWVCSWALAWHLPSHARGVRHTLSGFLGRHVEFSAIAHTSPGVTRLSGVQLHNPETRDVILTASVLEAAYDGEQLSVEVDGVRCLAGGLPELLDLLAEQLSGRWEAASGGRSVARVRVLPSQWIVATGDSADQTLDDVEIDLQLRDGAPQTRLQFRLPDHVGDQANMDDGRMTIVWMRNRNITPPTTGFVLDTGTAALPCSLLRTVHADFAALGSHATFRGKANLRLYADGWHGSIEGDLVGVPLDHLVTGGSGRLLSGEADIVRAQVVLEAGRITSAGGTISTAGGRVSQVLLAALADCNGMDVNVPDDGIAEIHKYDQLTCMVRLGADGLSLTAPGGDGVIMTLGDGSPLVRETATTVETLALAAALIPESDVMVPATPEAAAMMRWLPLPSAGGDRSGDDRIATPKASIKAVHPRTD